MKRRKLHLRAPLSVVVSMFLLTASLSSLVVASGAAEPEDSSVEESLPGLQLPTGTLTAKGHVTVNGNSAKTGATILGGNLIITGTDSHAVIDIGALGRVEMEEQTEITLTIEDKSVEISLHTCGSVAVSLQPDVKGLVKVIHLSDVGVFSERREVDVRVMTGEALVRIEKDKERVLKAGDHKEFDKAVEVSAKGEAAFKVYCDEDHIVPAFFLPLAGLLPLAGASGIEPPFLSTIQP